MYTCMYVIYFYIMVQQVFIECQLCARHTVVHKLSASKELVTF